jgi:ribonuclease HI
MLKMAKYYYAVAKGRSTGVYNDWSSCKKNVDGYSGASFKKFDTRAAAESFAAGGNDASSSSTSSSYGGYSSRRSDRNTPYSRTGYSSSNFSSSRSSSDRFRSDRSTSSIYRSNRHLSDTSEQNTSPRDGKLESVHTKQNVDDIYVDGASRGNGKSLLPISGYGVYYGENDKRNASVSLTEVDDVSKTTPTNQRAELFAIKHALSNIADDLRANNPKQSQIHTDSQYSISVYKSWAENWKSNGWKNSQGKNVANQDIIKSTLPILDYVNEEYRKKGWGEISLNHVRGHAGDVGNENADRLANEGADKMASNLSSRRV